ncbi:MAG TPA: hypothetical protein VJO32_05795 [Ktedonobacteraceae bacterium]|nr:hypothetical protein [Ktedonobacteraceae bacterium]
MATNERTSSIKQTATLKGDTQMTTNRETSVMKESKRKITAANLIRWTGLAAIMAGIIFAAYQPIQPPEVLSSVTTSAWAIITPLKTAMCLLFLLGWTGIYARQVKKAGWPGLAGFLLLSLSWALQFAFVFASAFILPLLATTAPRFVDNLLRSASGPVSGVNLGALPVLYTLVGISYILGGLLFGIATLRAGILSRWAAGLLAVASALPVAFVLKPVAALIPPQIQHLAAMPLGIAVAWLGYSLWSERREQASEPSSEGVSPQFRQTVAE